MTSSKRYFNKPMRRLLECYVLRAIDELDPSLATTLAEMEPKLREALKQPGDWYEVVAATMGFAPNMPELIRANWSKNLEIAKRNSVTLEPQLFAEMFVDDNLW